MSDIRPAADDHRGDVHGLGQAAESDAPGTPAMLTAAAPNTATRMLPAVVRVRMSMSSKCICMSSIARQRCTVASALSPCLSARQSARADRCTSLSWMKHGGARLDSPHCQHSSVP